MYFNTLNVTWTSDIEEGRWDFKKWLANRKKARWKIKTKVRVLHSKNWLNCIVP